MPFIKGKSGNPKGRIKLPKDIRALKKFNQIEFVSLMNKYINMSYPKLKEHYFKMQLDSKDMMIVSVIYMAVKYGDQKRFDFILNRLIGRVKEEGSYNVNVNDTTPHAEAANKAEHFENAVKRDPMLKNGTPRKDIVYERGQTTPNENTITGRSAEEWDQMLEGSGVSATDTGFVTDIDGVCTGEDEDAEP